MNKKTSEGNMGSLDAAARRAYHTPRVTEYHTPRVMDYGDLATLTKKGGTKAESGPNTRT